MCREAQRISKATQNHNLASGVRVTLNGKNLISLVGNESLGILYLASYWFLCAEYLMVLLDFKPADYWVEISLNYLTVLLADGHNEVVFAVWGALDQGALLVEVGLDDQVERETAYLLQCALLIPVLHPQKAFVSILHILVRPHIEEIHNTTLLHNDHYWMDWREGYAHYLVPQDKDGLKGEFLYVPDVDCAVLWPCAQQAIPDWGGRAGQLLMGISDVPDYLELALRVTLVNHYPPVQWAHHQQRVLLQENYLHYALVLHVLLGADVLQEIPGLWVKLTHIARSIPEEELATFISKLSCGYVRLERVLI